MKKTFLFLSLVLILISFSSVGLAADTETPAEYFCSQLGVDSSNYSINGDSVTLLKSIEVSNDTITTYGNITLNLNGNNITLTTEGGNIIIFSGGSLTVSGSGTISGASTPNYGVLQVGGNATSGNNGNLILNSGVTVKSTDGPAVEVINGNLEVNGATLNGQTAGIITNGGATTASSEITINSGNITSSNTAIYDPADDTLTINGGTISGTYGGVEKRGGTLNVTGGTITCSNSATPTVQTNNSGASVNGAGLAIAPYNNYSVKVNISGGTVSGPDGVIFANTSTSSLPKGSITANITSGTIKGTKDTSIATLGVTNNSSSKAPTVNNSNNTSGQFISGGSYTPPVNNTSYLSSSVAAAVYTNSSKTAQYFTSTSQAVQAAQNSTSGKGQIVLKNDISADGTPSNQAETTTLLINLNGGDPGSLDIDVTSLSGSSYYYYIIPDNTTQVTLGTPTQKGDTFKSWTASGGTITGTTFTGWNKNSSETYTITANWNVNNTTPPEPTQITINVSNPTPSMGSIEGAGTYTSGDQVTLTAKPVPGYSFVGWKINGTSDYLSTKNPYAFTASENLDLIAVFLPSEDVENTVTVYRLYNPINGEHLFTPSELEVSTLTTSQNWVSEEVGWYAPVSGDPVYRLYNPVLHNHLYTTNTYEVDYLTANEGWVKDFNGDPIFYAGGDVPIYRLYNPQLNGAHLLTTNYFEFNVIPEYGWIQEGIAFNAVAAGSN